MARIRSIKPDACTDEKFADCSTTARLLFVLMQCFVDDGGVHPAKPRTLKAEVFPMDDFSADQVSAWIDELIAAGLLSEFEAEGQRFWLVNDWSTLQKIEKPSFKYPRPTGPISPTARRPLDEDSTTTRRPLDDASPPEGKGMEGKGEEEQSPTAPPPSAPSAKKADRKRSLPAGFSISDAVRSWAEERGFAPFLPAHLEHFIGYAKAKGATYVDWDQAFMNAIGGDWGDVRKKAAPTGRGASVLSADEQFAMVTS